MNKLKSCPLCKSTPVFWKCIDGLDGFEHGTTVQCEHCGISISEEYESEAFAKWNNRPIEDAALLSIVEAIREYQYALDTRQHGGVAQDKAFNSICQAMDMYWKQGEEKNRREAEE